MSAAKLKVSRSTASSSKSGMQFDLSMLLSVVLLVMALLQLIGFTSFSNWLEAAGFSSTSAWAVIVILLEVAAAMAFLRLTLPPLAKWVTRACAVLASGFWFVESVRLVADSSTATLTSSGFFGKYLQQTPGWWSVLEATVLILWTLYALEETE